MYVKHTNLHWSKDISIGATQSFQYYMRAKSSWDLPATNTCGGGGEKLHTGILIVLMMCIISFKKSFGDIIARVYWKTPTDQI